MYVSLRARTRVSQVLLATFMTLGMRQLVSMYALKIVVLQNNLLSNSMGGNGRDTLNSQAFQTKRDLPVVQMLDIKI